MKFKNIGLSIAFLGSLVGLASCGTKSNVPNTGNNGTDTSTGGSTNTGNGGSTDSGNTGTNTGDSTNTGGSTDTNTGGSSDSGNSGNTDTSTGDSGSTDSGNTGTNTGDSTNTGGSTGSGDTGTVVGPVNPGTNTDGGNTDTSTGGSTDTSTGGSTDSGNTGTNTGGSTDGNTGGSTDTSTGGSDYNNSGSSTSGDKITPTTPSVDKGSSTLEFQEVAGDLEALYAKFGYVDGASSYNAYIKEDGATSYTKIDKELIRKYSSYYRVDMVGLKSGYYTLKVCPVVDGVEQEGAVAKNITVQAHERSGFGFVKGTGAKTKVTTNTSSGAYNDNGILKSNATVVYVSNSNKDSVKAVINGATVTSLQGIITAAKKSSTPLCIRMIGNITDPTNCDKGDIVIDAVTCGITVEGIGDDTTCNGFGIRVKNSSNVEIRNLGFMNCHSNEGDNVGLQQGNDHVWVHNNDMFYGDAGSDADQVKGDGALDTKTSSYITHSYNHFYDNGKCNLQGMKSEETTNYITYHHNWYDHSDSRHPRIRTCTVHIYNNYFDGNAKYGVGMTMGGSAFVENNYFRSTATMRPMLISGQGTDAAGEGTFSGENGGIIKAYNNTFDGDASFISQKESATSFDAYVVESRNEQIPSSVTALKGGTTYNNFDTNSSIMYSYSVDTPEEAKAKVQSYAGRVGGGDFKWTFDNSVDDASYAVIPALKTALTQYKDSIVSVFVSDESSSSSGSSDSSSDTTTQTKTAEEVIALIDALPESASVTAADRNSIKAARSAFAVLSTEEQLKVTNISKLIACEEAYAALPQTTEVLTFPTKTGDNSYFTVNGSLKNGISKTYDGVEYTNALKMESSTTITFECTSDTTLIIVSDTASKSIKVNGTKYTSDSNGVFEISITAGTITITKGDSMNVYAVIVG